MTFESIIYESNNGVATLTLNRPDALNSFTTAMHGEVAEALKRTAADNSVRALLITSTGRGFCAGQDLSDSSVSADADLGVTIDTHYNPLIRAITSLPMPVVCAVNGVAAGAGANIALAADIVIAAKSAKFIQAFCKIGLIPDSGGSWILPKLIGHARATALALTGEAVSAEKAEAWGMIYKAVADEELLNEARQLCQHFATQPTQGLAAIKQALQQSWSNNLNDQLDLERDFQSKLGQSDDYREGTAAFIEKRRPKFTGH